jgi:dethiobiotin synthetase
MRQLPKRIFIAGTGTGIGKTVVSAILTEALHADYWKPIQCGNLEETDTQVVQGLVSNNVSRFYPEAYRLKTPSSPHFAARAEGVEINPDRLRVPESEIRLLIEGAGGLLVPLSNDYLLIDLIKYLQASVILVSKNYLGSINHTLLSAEALKQRGLDVLGIVYNGLPFLDNREIVHHFSQLNALGEVDMTGEVTKEFIKDQAAKLKTSLAEHYIL